MQKPKETRQKKCEICETDATSLCLTCQNYYCESCFKLVHDKKPKSHVKETIDRFVPIDIKCPEHPSVPLNLFCTDEKGILIYIILYIFSFIIIYRIMLFFLFL